VLLIELFFSSNACFPPTNFVKSSVPSNNVADSGSVLRGGLEEADEPTFGRVLETTLAYVGNVKAIK
jgi:hypothetical protein